MSKYLLGPYDPSSPRKQLYSLVGDNVQTKQTATFSVLIWSSLIP